jgi:phosphatidylglycerophosphatase A
MTPARLIASGLGTGYLPIAPGSWASLGALLPGAALMLAPPGLLPMAILVASLGGLWSIHALGAGDNDPGWVVIDEVAGMWVTLLGLARPTLTGLAAAFLLFRLLDVVKPGPVGWADRQHNPAGIMGDDLIAGAIAAGILWAVRTRWPGLL